MCTSEHSVGCSRTAPSPRHNQQQVLLRLTNVRALRLLGHALRCTDGPIDWAPTRHDQLQPGCSQDPVKGRLIVLRLKRSGFRPQWLCLFTTLEESTQYPQEQLVRLYGLRWHV